MKKNIYILLTLTLCALPAFAQNSQDTIFSRNISIIREYLPTINDADKINTLPRAEEIENRKTDIDYSTWSSPLSTNFNLQTLPAATIKRMKQKRLYKEKYLRLGAGNYNSLMGDFFLPITRGDTHELDLYIKHLSSFGKVKQTDSTKVLARNIKNELDLSFVKNFYYVDLFSNLNFEGDFLDYYGTKDSVYTYDDSPENTMLTNKPLSTNALRTTFNYTLGIASKPKLGGFNYGLSSQYISNINRFQEDFRYQERYLNENLILSKAYIKSNMEQNEYGINLALDNIFYHSFKHDSLTYMLNNYSLLELSPYYFIEDKEWNIKLGLKSYFSFNKGQAVYAAPDIVGNLTLVKDILYTYASIGGELKANTMHHLFRENPYLSYVDVEHTHTPFDAKIGAKVRLFEQLICNGFMGYKYISNQYFFTHHQDSSFNNISGAGSNHTSMFEVETDDAGVFTAGFSANYDIHKKLELDFKSIYYHWNTKKLDFAYYQPSIKVDFNLNYHINEDIQVSFNSHILGGRKALGYEGEKLALKPIIDCSLKGIYEHNSTLSAFLHINNLFAQRYQIWDAYPSHQLNAMAGIMISF